LTSILDRFLDAQQPFIATSSQEYLALQIARKLSELGHVKEYTALLEHFSQETVIHSFRRAQARGRGHHEGFLAAFRELTTQPDEHEIGGD
jgi:hypothetical protein